MALCHRWNKKASVPGRQGAETARESLYLLKEQKTYFAQVEYKWFLRRGHETGTSSNIKDLQNRKMLKCGYKWSIHLPVCVLDDLPTRGHVGVFIALARSMPIYQQARTMPL